MNYTHLNNPKARMEVLKLKETFNLVDIFRKTNRNLKRYTWRRKNPIKQGRLDFFLYLNHLQTEYHKLNMKIVIDQTILL